MPFEGVRERSDESKLRAVHRYAGRSSRFLRVADEASVFKYASSLLEHKKKPLRPGAATACRLRRYSSAVTHRSGPIRPCCGSSH